MIRVGIVGTGYTIGIASMHIKAYQRIPGVRITAVHDLLPEQAKEYVERFGLSDAVVCDTYAELLSRVDAVSICTPNDSHVALSIEALQAGRHVLCEKPFSIDAESCDAAVAAAEAAAEANGAGPLVAMIGLCYRGIPGFAWMKQLISEGALGEIFFVRQSQGGARIADPRVKLEWRMQQALSGPGATADFGSHMLDMTDYLLRDRCGRIAEVQCMQGMFIPNRERIDQPGTAGLVDNDDVAVFNARMENGTLVSFTASRIGCDHTFEAFGSGGYIGFNGARPFELVFQQKDPAGGYAGPRETRPVPEALWKTDEAVPAIPFEVNFYHEVREFVRAIEDGTPTELTFARGRYVQRLIDAVQRSAETGAIVKTDFAE